MSTEHFRIHGVSLEACSHLTYCTLGKLTRLILAGEQSQANTETDPWLGSQGMTAAWLSGCEVQGHSLTKCQGRPLGSPDLEAELLALRPQGKQNVSVSPNHKLM